MNAKNVIICTDGVRVINMLYMQKFIKWGDIIGLRVFPSRNILSAFIHPDCEKPSYAQICLRNGKVVGFDSHINISREMNNSSEECKDDKETNYSFMQLIELIKAKSVNINPYVNDWSEWRIFVTLISFTVISFISSLLHAAEYEFIILVLTSAILVSLLVGSLWEYHARKKYWK